MTPMHLKYKVRQKEVCSCEYAKDEVYSCIVIYCLLLYELHMNLL